MIGFPDLSKQFIVETNACNSGVEAVLIQEKHPLFYSYKISGRLCSTSIYIKEMYAITEDVGKWRHYLLGSHFLIKTKYKESKKSLNSNNSDPRTTDVSLQITWVLLHYHLETR